MGRTRRRNPEGEKLVCRRRMAVKVVVPAEAGNQASVQLSARGKVERGAGTGHVAARGPPEAPRKIFCCFATPDNKRDRVAARGPPESPRKIFCRRNRHSSTPLKE